jgi:hypothetical protein
MHPITSLMLLILATIVCWFIGHFAPWFPHIGLATGAGYIIGLWTKDSDR